MNSRLKLMSDIIPPPAHVIKFYMKLQKELENTWGENSIILLMNGKFYEIYQVDSDGKAFKASEALSMQISLKNGSSKAHSIDNPYMVGFPEDKLSNHLAKLLRKNLVVDIYDQVSVPGHTKKGYVHNELFTPGTYIDEYNENSNYISAIKINRWKCPIYSIELQSLHCVLLDLSTGESGYLEVYDEKNKKKTESELIRILKSYRPKEILITEPIKIIEPTNIIERESNPEWSKLSYQNKLFKKIFNIENGIKTPLETLNLGNLPEISLLFVNIYSYAWNLNKNIVKRLKFPKDLGVSNHLLLNRDTVVQMHLLGENNSLESCLKATKTPMGARLLKSRLIAPLISPDKLNEIYDQTECLYNIEIPNLRAIGDIERRTRKMMTRSLKEYELVNLYESVEFITKILNDDLISIFYIDKLLIKRLKKFLNKITDEINLNEIRKKEIFSNYFNNDEELKIIEDKIISKKGFFHNLAQKLTELIEGSVTVDSTDRDGYYLKTTKTRLKKISKDFNCNIDNIHISFDDFYIEVLSNSVKIKSKLFMKLNSDIRKLKEELVQILDKKYNEFLKYLTENYYDDLITISDIIAEIDFVSASSEISKKRGYSRPIIVDSKGYFNAKKLRHPIIENIIESEYIPNDIFISQSGMLIYGINTVGKSSLLRSIGTALIMAQAGLFVAAESFQYGIYNKIISKISTIDEQFSGKSTFMMELEQISDMVTRSDENTLVISDELCCSTEWESAHALVAATIEKLMELNSSFVFSTHLRDLQFMFQEKRETYSRSLKNFDEPNSSNLDEPKLKIMHMKAYIENNKLTSDRVLKDGGIVDNYGLELASAWGMSEDFMKRAYNLRDNNNELVSTKTSNYNKNVYMDCCKLCGSKKNLHTHHIKEQATADKNGLIESRFHKNKSFNLLVVCEDCHRKIHG